MLGARLIKSGRARRAIVGGVDSLAKYTVNGFNSLKILSDAPCKPFDEDRDGLNLGEGAAYLVLEAENVVGDKKIYAEVAGYGNANDAHHPSAMSDEATGAIRSMREAVESAGIGFDLIGYINAHGTGTQNNDGVELTGMAALFEKIPPFNSTKSYTGHTLGAAGAIEAVYSILLRICARTRKRRSHHSCRTRALIMRFPIRSDLGEIALRWFSKMLARASRLH
jgi:3-oxoacyl-(acyl-carrier-protein) synthase